MPNAIASGLIVVKANDPRAFRQQAFGEVRPDEASASCDERRHASSTMRTAEQAGAIFVIYVLEQHDKARDDPCGLAIAVAIAGFLASAKKTRRPPMRKV